MTDIVIAEAVRSAVGRAIKGSLALSRPDELAGQVVAGLLARVPQLKPAEVEDLILGCAMPEGEQGLNIARVVGLLGGLPEETSAMTINRFCSSGLQAIALAAGSIAAGYNQLVMAGGVESMSMVPMTGNKLSASPEAMRRVSYGLYADGNHRRERGQEVQRLARRPGRVRAQEPAEGVGGDQGGRSSCRRSCR